MTVNRIAGIKRLSFASQSVVSSHSTKDDIPASSLIPHPSSLIPPSESFIPPSGELTNQIRAYRFLICWIAAYLLFFTAAATKLPHYILPIYPAMAILTARFLTGWRKGETAVPRWLMLGTIATTVLVGLIYTTCVIVGDWFFPGVGVWAAMGVIPLIGAIWMGYSLRKGYRGGLILAVTVTSILFMGLMVSLPPTAIEPYKGIKELVRESGIDDRTRDLRVGQFEGLPPSLVFYAGREIQELLSPAQVVEFLSVPTPAYLVVQEPTWHTVLAPKVTVPVRVVARHYDLLREGYVVVVTNEMEGEQRKR
jgi:4-amino-4-deoxy-L-arabinose transferase-like glycosyltransferase